MANWVEGRVAAVKHWTGGLYSLQVEADVEPFRAGQFTKLGLELDGDIVGRPYSLVNAPHERPLEFYFNVVPGGPLSPRLATLSPGSRILVAPRASGFMVMEEIPRGDHLWLVATGTGIGPFLSILKTIDPWQRFRRILLVHAVRLANELSYGGLIRGFAAAHPDRFVFIPFVSREATGFALAGRIPAAIADGRLEARAGVAIDTDSQFMLCGNPDMVRDTTDALTARGLKKHRRRDPGQITVENYW
ncbi:MAG: ferredoxin--NADP reductase [Pseudomonadota bacterium]|jgi:ferredoxin--NADP+ reductase